MLIRTTSLHMPRRSRLKLGLVPEFLHAGAGQIGKAAALLRGGGFHPLETLFKFAIGALQRDFRVHTEETSDVDTGEEQIANFFLDMGRGSSRRRPQTGFDLTALFVELVENAREIVSVKADTRGAARELIGFERAGE